MELALLWEQIWPKFERDLSRENEGSTVIRHSRTGMQHGERNVLAQD
jgi:hypothetical protein